MNANSTKLAAVVFGLCSLISQSALAACAQAGLATTYIQTSAGLSFFIREGENIWFCITDNQRFAAAGAAAVAFRNRAFVAGDAANCPTSGVFRNMGSCTVININPDGLQTSGLRDGEVALKRHLESAAGEDPVEAIRQFLEERNVVNE